MGRTRQEYQERAESMLDSGFKNETARKDCLDYLNRAADAESESFRSALLDARDAGVIDGNGKAFNAMYYTPSLCHWNEKRAAVYDSYPDYVANMGALATLRARAKGAPLISRESLPKSKTAMEAAERAAKAMTCQICGRDILAEGGVIAHHGYERPGDGWQTASCWGARELPYEADRAKLGAWCDALRRELAGLEKSLADQKAERVEYRYYWQEADPESPRWNRRYTDKKSEPFTRATFAAVMAAVPDSAFHGRGPRELVTFDTVKTARIAKTETKRRHVSDNLEFQTRRFDGWEKTHSWGAANQEAGVVAGWWKL